MAKLFGVGMENTQPGETTHPEPTRTILKQRRNVVAGDAILAFGVVDVVTEGVCLGMVTAQAAVLGPDPRRYSHAKSGDRQGYAGSG